MRLTEKYRPRCLADVVGQPPVRLLATLARDPQECCQILEGPPGTGKTSAALAFAEELGCVDPWTGLEKLVSTELTIEKCRDLFHGKLRLRPMGGSGWKVLVIEELEAATSAQVTRFLKEALEDLPERLIVIATSNNTEQIEEALLQRFKVRLFRTGKLFAEACARRLAQIWEAEAGEAVLPPGWERWGWRGDRFSMRSALSEMEDQLSLLEVA